jgi:DNA-binding NarL/FixJ family response regulator
MPYTRHIFGNCYLTPREVQIISCLIEGKSIQQIADFLRTARSTVKTQLERLYYKSGCKDQKQLIMKALKCGFDFLGNFTEDPNIQLQGAE